MSNVEFDEGNFQSNRYAGQSAKMSMPAMVRLLLKTGLVKNEKQANYALIGIAVCAFLLTLYVIKDMFGGSANQNTVVPVNVLQNRVILGAADNI